jgi:hypothetical protein
MKKNYLNPANLCRKMSLVALAAFSIFTNAKAQSIIGPDTVLIGSTASYTLSTGDKFLSYAWEFESNSLTSVLSSSMPISNTGTNGNKFSLSSSACMVFDTSKNSYHAFVTCATEGFSAPNVQRIDFGSNPNNPSPVTVNLGNPNSAFITNSGGYFNMEDMKVVMDDQGVFHAFINNGGIVHWVFGNGIDNPPTLASRIFTNPSVLGMSMNMAVIKYGEHWYIFVGQTFGASPGLVRLNLGGDLNNIPSTIPYVIYDAPQGYNYLDYFAIIKLNGQWHLSISSHMYNSPLFRYDFGADLLNPNPIITNLGVTNPPLNKKRGANFIKSCDSFYMLGLNEDGEVLTFNYQNNITSTPVVQSLGQKFGNSVAMQIFYPYWYNDTLWSLSANWQNNPNSTISRFPLATISSGNAVIKYYDPATSHTFNTAGLKTIRLYCDQGDNRGPQAFCKEVYVKDPTSIQEENKNKNIIQLFPNPATNFISLASPKEGAFTYRVLNTEGKRVIENSNVKLGMGEQLNIDVRNLAAGFYYIQIMDQSGSAFSGKFIKR